MAKIRATSIAVPPYSASTELAIQFAREHYAAHVGDIEKYLAIFEHSGIENRHFCVPPEWFLSPKTFQEKNQAYVEWSAKLACQAVEGCLAKAELAPADVDNIIFVSTTGMATPSPDARVINTLRLNPNIRRTPVWGLGCVGGASGLILAYDYLKANPEANVLVVAVELCGLTFLFDDYSISNLVATSLFADGAACVLLSGDGEGPEIIGVYNHTWPDTLNIMGWNFLDQGLQVIFSKAIPTIVRQHAHGNLTRFLAQHEMSLSDISYFLIHPGGPRVLDAYRAALGLNSNSIDLSEEILRDHGNMSSATIFYILDRFLGREYERNKYGLLTAVGPGFTSSSVLFRC